MAFVAIIYCDFNLLQSSDSDLVLAQMLLTVTFYLNMSKKVNGRMIL